MSGLPGQGMLESQQDLLTVEETKYLGGDLEHTHLVKGLDYALLQKVQPNWQFCSRLSAWSTGRPPIKVLLAACAAVYAGRL